MFNTHNLFANRRQAYAEWTSNIWKVSIRNFHAFKMKILTSSLSHKQHAPNRLHFYMHTKFGDNDSSHKQTQCIGFCYIFSVSVCVCALADTVILSIQLDLVRLEICPVSLMSPTWAVKPYCDVTGQWELVASSLILNGCPRFALDSLRKK